MIEMASVFDNRRHAPLRWLWLSALVVVLDQVSKALIAEHMRLFDIVRITSWFDLMLLHNTGAAFSFLNHAGGWQRWFFVGLGLLVPIIIVLWLWRMPGQGRHWLAAALSLILGGALGNAIGRIANGYVIDFILVHYQSWSWPAFNLADSAIVIGAVMIVIDALWRSRRSHSQESSARDTSAEH
jgi:signal peptidase II